MGAAEVDVRACRKSPVKVGFLLTGQILLSLIGCRLQPQRSYFSPEVNLLSSTSAPHSHVRHNSGILQATDTSIKPHRSNHIKRF